MSRFRRVAVDVWGDAPAPENVEDEAAGLLDSGANGRGWCANPRCQHTEPGRLDGRLPLCPATGFCTYGCCVALTFPTEHVEAGCECWGDAADDDGDDE